MGPVSLSTDQPPAVPTRLLIGVMLILWGALSQHPVMGILAAVLVEGHRWVRWRWPFSAEDYVRIWNLCMALFIFVAVCQFIGRETAPLDFNRAFQRWLPMLLLPIVLAQYYGVEKTIPIVTFSLIARRKRERDHQIGRWLDPVKSIHVGYFYVAVLLLSIGSLTQGLPGMFALVALLVAWIIYPFVPGSSVTGSAIVFAFAAGLGFLIQHGLSEAHAYVEKRSIQWLRHGGDHTDAHRSRTRIGEIGEDKHLSNEIVWRLEYLEGDRPDLIREATYDVFRNEYWVNPRRDYEKVLPAYEGNEQDWEIFPLSSEDTNGALRIRGNIKRDWDVLPSPRGLGLILNLPAHHVEQNSLGSLRFQPRHRAFAFTAFFGDLPTGIAESQANTGLDLEINISDEGTIQEIVDQEEGLIREGAAADKIEAVKAFFLHNGFSYSRYLPDSLGVREQAIRQFLTETRRGHCEFYATATVLLLREMGVPARYAVGYAVREYDEDSNEFLLRGVHRHAWAQAWVGGEWVEVDTTPSNWLESEMIPLTSWDKLRDYWQERSLAFNLWRLQENKGIWWSVIPLLLAAAMLAIVILRIVRGVKKPSPTDADPGLRRRQEEGAGTDSEWYRLEKELARHHAMREPAMTPLRWYRQAAILFPKRERELSDLIRLHYRLRFDPLGLKEGDRERLRSGVQELIDTLRQRPT